MADGSIREVLERSIDELPVDSRIVYVACVVDGMTPDQFAELFELPSETVKVRLQNACDLLFELLMRELSHFWGKMFLPSNDRCERITNAVMNRLYPSC